MVRVIALLDLGGLSCGSGFLEGPIGAQASRFAVAPDESLPSLHAAAPEDARGAARVALRQLGIAVTGLVVDVAQIRDAVVAVIAIPVAAFLAGPFAVMQRPSDAVSLEIPAAHGALIVAIAIYPDHGGLSGVSAVPARACFPPRLLGGTGELIGRPSEPTQYASLRVICQQPPQFVDCGKWARHFPISYDGRKKGRPLAEPAKDACVNAAPCERAGVWKGQRVGLTKATRCPGAAAGNQKTAGRGPGRKEPRAKELTGAALMSRSATPATAGEMSDRRFD